MMKKILFAVLLALSCLPLAAQDVYVATDKGCYLAGENIGCSAFCAKGPSVVLLELVSSDGVAAMGKLAVAGGRGAGVLRIPFGTPTGNYRLRACLPGGTPAGGPVISVFNTLSTDRVKDGVEVVGSLSSAPKAFETGYGFSVEQAGDSLVIRNLSGAAASVCLSLYREDSLQPVMRSSIAGFKLPAPSEPSDGEVIRGRITGPDASAATGVILAVPGSATDCYRAEVQEDGTFSVHTENIFGDVDIVCIPSGLGEGRTAHAELEQVFSTSPEPGLPKLEICRSMEADLLRRTAAMQERQLTDTLTSSLPVQAGHFFLEHECTRYVLDDYTRFPTMEEVFVEIIPQVRMRRKGGKPSITLLIPSSVSDGMPRWGDAVVMVDGVPVLAHSLIESYAPAIIKTIDVYPYRYYLGPSDFDGVVNLVTFDGRMPGLLLPDNIRIYGFHGCSLPQAFKGSETLFWHPLVDIPAGGSVSVPCAGVDPGVFYTLSVEGISADGVPLYLRKTFF